MEPAELSLQQLQYMTDDFSEERKLGQGGYGTVYRGEDRNGQEVAVKLLHDAGLGLCNEDFRNEFENLKKLNHPNIMKLIGYCYETKHRPMKYNGKTVFAEQTYRALCLEHLHNGSLQNFLSEGICDGRLDWHTRFKIIKGACEGLKYLHEEFKEPIYHLDLKPDNILLDINLVPKLADFGLSKIFGVEQTRITQNCSGTFGYMPPEYIERGVISSKFDIYSMGVVMVKTISGLNGLSRRDDMPAQGQFIDLVHDSWRVKLQENWSGSSLEAYCQQVKRCMEIALKCVEVDKQKRPNIVDIVRELSEMEIATDKISRCPGGQLLSVYPFQLVFSFVIKSGGYIVAPLHLTNNTDDNIQFRLLIPRHGEYETRFVGMLSGPVLPRTMLTSFLTLFKPPSKTPWRLLPANGYEFFTLEFWRQGQEDEVHQLKLVARYEPQVPGAENEAAPFKIIPWDAQRSHTDVHPSVPWFIVVESCSMRMYNYVTERSYWVKMSPGRSILQRLLCRDEPIFTTAKFIARKNWIVAGDSSGRIYVYTYDGLEIHRLEQAHWKSVTYLEIHPAEPYMLSVSEDGYIKLWNFENEWKVMRVFGHFVLPWEVFPAQHKHVAFHPKDPCIFVTVQDCIFKIWNLHLSEFMWSIKPYENLVLTLLKFFSRGDQVFLIGGFREGIIKVWDFHSMQCVKTLETPFRAVRAACSHPDLPLLITGSADGTICLWNSTNFELERTLSFGLGPVMNIGFLKGSRRIMILYQYHVALTKIGSEETGASIEVAA